MGRRGPKLEPTHLLHTRETVEPAVAAAAMATT